MFAILYFSLNLDKGAWPRKISKIRVLFYGPNRRSRYFQIKIKPQRIYLITLYDIICESVRLEVASNKVKTKFCFWWSLGRGVTNSKSKLCNSLPQLILWQTGLHSDGEDYGIKGEGWSRVLTVWITISIQALCKFLPKFALTWKKHIRCVHFNQLLEK